MNVTHCNIAEPLARSYSGEIFPRCHQTIPNPQVHGYARDEASRFAIQSGSRLQSRTA